MIKAGTAELPKACDADGLRRFDNSRVLPMAITPHVEELVIKSLVLQVEHR